MQTTLSTPCSDDALLRQAKKRVEMKMGFLTHLTVFVLVNAGLYLLNLLRGDASWQIFPLWGWGLGLTIHGLVTLLSLQGQDLRTRMMEAELKALRQRNEH